ncbi:MAG: hydantoinase/oxoprolinase family protein [Candidatus Methanomethylophilaceae archaeon]|nr:hydantoinase/oxoprolinase family protein [Candidatus Methanomethylophilaceae archaeon]
MTQRSEYDQWVQDWIRTEKEGGRKCFDVKKSGNSYYVYYQTTRYNSQTKKREKVSGYLGKLVEGVGLVEPDTYSDDFEKVTNARYGLGVDTGGTFTDAVIVDLDDNTVVAKRKSPTTHHDLSIGLGNSVRAVFESCDIKPEDISLVGISTTLATNSILEGHGGEVGLILIGWNPMEPVHFGEKNQVFVKGGYDSKGQPLAPMSKAEVTEAIKKVSEGVDAIAISGLFSIANSSQEKKVKELAIQLTGLPVIAGHELSAAMGIDLRAETAVLNGKLISIVSKFFDDVERTFKEVGVKAPIMVYKGDGSVMTIDNARIYPIETILSGPAASSMGGMMLSGYEDCLMVDIGGTSTDIAIMEGGFPQIQFEGASVGKWRTRVKAVDMSTVALGGDSKVTLDGPRFILGPDRVIPLCTYAEEHPEVIGKIIGSDTFEYYEALEGIDRSVLNEKELRIFDNIEGKGPLSKLDIMGMVEGLWVIDEELNSMVRKEVLRIASLTPTDVMVFLKKFTLGSKAGADAGITALSNKLGMTKKQAATALFDEIKTQVAEAVMSKVFDDRFRNWYDHGSRVLMRRLVSKVRNDTIEIMPKFKIPIVGVGAPSKFMMEDLADRLNATVVFPEHNDVGNAIGAITSKVSESLSATITPTPDYRFMASIPFMGSSYYTHLDTAISATRRWLENYLTKKIAEFRCTNIKASSKVKTYMATEGGVGDWEEESIARTINFVEVVSRVIGDPPENQ